MYEFSKTTLRLLYDAGLRLDYIYDTSDYESNHEENGCNVPNVVLDFLKQYGGLNIAINGRIQYELSDYERQSFPRFQNLPIFHFHILRWLFEPHYQPIKSMHVISWSYVLSFDPEYAAEGQYCDVWSIVYEALNVGHLYPIGGYADRLALFMCGEGEIYSIADGCAYFLAESGEVLIEGICNDLISSRLIARETPRGWKRVKIRPKF